MTQIEVVTARDRGFDLAHGARSSMNHSIQSLLEGAAGAVGTVAIIDVFRAFTPPLLWRWRTAPPLL
jgi:hypothetical protein